MKFKRKNQSILFRGLVLTMALALTVLCLPFNEMLMVYADLLSTDYSHMTIGKVDEEVSTSVTKGSTYYIPKAYIGGDKDYVVGNNISDANVKTSKVTVHYSSVLLGGVENGAALKGGDNETGIVSVATDSSSNYLGSFVADKIGAYTITYSYSYEIEGTTYSNSYEFKVESELTNASINFVENEKSFIPSVIDLALAKNGDTYKDLYLPTPELVDEENETVENVTYVTDRGEVGAKGNYVVVSAIGGVNSNTVTISKNVENEKLYISGDVFKNANLGAGKYTITYAYYIDGQFVTSSTKSTQVYAENNKYYTDYSLKLELASDWTDNGQTGVETKLPSATGVTSKDSKPASEKVDVYYTVSVYYKAANSDKNYELINATEYNEEAGEKIVNEDGTLVDATKFKPLNDGWYTFVYSITDFYGNTVSSTKGVYEYANIKDEQDPTPVVYEAKKEGEKNTEDQSYKLASRSVPNGVVVYAIGIDDNVSKADTKGVVLSRKIMTSETVSKLTITDYNEYNLVFNYRNTTNPAYVNLRTNNYIIRKQTGSVSSDVDMLNWLKENKYLIVVDNANASTIYDIFNAENYFDEIESVKTALANLSEDATEDEIASAKRTAAVEWLKSSASKEAGFAYLDVKETFGATSAENGMGSGQYYIHYIAKDAAGNEKDVSKSMYIGTYTDNDIPELRFPTTLSDFYFPTDVVKFDAPTASDNYDTNMLVRTTYRYLDVNGNVLDVNDKDGKVSNENLTDLRLDLDGKRVDNQLLTEKYNEYLKGEANGYVELTDKNASSYSIDLAKDLKYTEKLKNAVSLQIVSYVYDDNGNANIYGETISILNTIDNAPPKFVEPEETISQNTYEQGAEIELPSLTVMDDAVAFMDFEVNVYYVNGDTRTKISTYDFSSEREVLSESGAGKYTVNAGKFVAAFAGKYEASISVKDSKNNTIVSFANYTVSSRNIIQPPVINASLESKTVQLDGDDNYNPKDGITIPTPSVSYQIPDSVTYDVYSKNPSAYTDTTYVVKGVNANGKATNWSTTYGQQGSFKPTATGEYPIAYTVNLTVYNHKTFKYIDVDPSNDYKGGYYEFTNNGKTAEVVLNKEGKFEATITEGLYVIEKTEDGNVVIKKENIETSVPTNSALDGVDFETWFADMKNYNLTSDVYTIIVEDSKGPSIAEELYPTAISTEEISATEGYKLPIYAIQATDASGINMDKSKVVLSWKLANGTTGSHTYEKLSKDTEYTIKSSNGNVLDGTYTVTYTVYDNNNNYTTKEYTIAVGDNVAPTLKFDDKFVEEKFEIGNQLKIDISKVKFTDNKPFQENVKPTIKLVNSSTSKEIKYDVVGDTYIFEEFEEVGTYNLTVEIEDAVGNKTTESFSIEVSAKSSDTTMTYKVVGTILIVVSVLVLVGVIVYFIVSKVKLDKELKK